MCQLRGGNYQHMLVEADTSSRKFSIAMYGKEWEAQVAVENGEGK